MSTPDPQGPVAAGPYYRQAAALNIPDTPERQLLLLLAGFADAGERSPRAVTLAALLNVTVLELDVLLDRLIWQGMLRVWWARRDGRHARPGQRAHRGRRNVYQLRFPQELAATGAPAP